MLRVCFPIQQWCPFWWFLLNMQFENHFSLPFLRLFLDVCVCMLNHFSCVRLFATLWTIACQVPLSMLFSRQECWSGLPCPPSGHLPDSGIEPRSPALQADTLPSEPFGKPHKMKGKLKIDCCCCSATKLSLTVCNPMD